MATDPAAVRDAGCMTAYRVLWGVLKYPRTAKYLPQSVACQEKGTIAGYSRWLVSGAVVAKNSVGLDVRHRYQVTVLTKAAENELLVPQMSLDGEVVYRDPNCCHLLDQ